PAWRRMLGSSVAGIGALSTGPSSAEGSYGFRRSPDLFASMRRAANPSGTPRSRAVSYPCRARLLAGLRALNRAREGSLMVGSRGNRCAIPRSLDEDAAPVASIVRASLIPAAAFAVFLLSAHPVFAAARIALIGAQIDDSTANNDGSIEPGETVSVRIEL